MKTLSGIVVSAGSSTRFGQSKQLVRWDDRPLIAHTLERLRFLPLKELVLVVRPEDEAAIRNEIPANLPMRFVHGGARRQDSVRNGLIDLSNCDRVFVHDGARPFLSEDFLSTLWEESQKWDAVVPGLGIVETLKEVNADRTVVKTHDRKKFFSIQTPQFFSYELLVRAHEQFKNSEVEFTDDSAMVEALGASVKIVDGARENKKVTVMSDLREAGIHV